MEKQKEYIKDFDAWNSEKKSLDKITFKNTLFEEGEIWWVSLGINIGREIDGKHENFERPVFILRKFSADTLWIVPLTSTDKVGTYFKDIEYNQEKRTLVLIQLRLISSKRLLRKMRDIDKNELNVVKEAIIKLLT